MVFKKNFEDICKEFELFEVFWEKFNFFFDGLFLMVNDWFK